MSKKYRTLDESQRVEIFTTLKLQSADGKVRYGDLTLLAKKFDVSTRTIYRIWQNGQSSSLKSKRICREVNKDVILTMQKQIAALPSNQRGDIRTMAAALNIPKSTLHDRLKAGYIKPATVTLKPLLTPENMAARLQFALSHTTVDRGIVEFHPMNNIVHVDEKLFYLKRIRRKVYLAPWEDAPFDTTRNKRFIPSVMVLAAVARPRQVDGKLGVWAFVQDVPAKRWSRNRPAGTIEIKPVNVNKANYKEMLISNVLPTILSKFPKDITEITLQQDNATPHGFNLDEDVLHACKSDDRVITIRNQPANSPDMNLLDLGLFNAIQTIQQRKHASTIKQLINNVEVAFHELPITTVTNVIYSLQLAMESTMANNGGNKYKLRHIGKDEMRRNGSLPETLECDSGIYFFPIV